MGTQRAWLFAVATAACRIDGAEVAGGTGATETSTSETVNDAGSTTTTSEDTSTGTGGTSDSSSSTGADSSGGLIDPSGGDPVECGEIVSTWPSCGAPGPAPEGPFEAVSVALPLTINPLNACPCLLENHPADFEIFAPDGWPSDPESAPLALFAHGNGVSSTRYGEIIDIFVNLGFVVVNVDIADDVGFMNYAQDMRCAAEAMKNAFGEALRCELVLAGHSQGGTAAFEVAATAHDEPYASIFHPFDLQALVLLTPAYQGSQSWFPPSNAVPALIFQASNDRQVSGHAGILHDLFSLEAFNEAYEAERTLVSVDGTGHGDFASAMPDRARASVEGYVPAFVRAQVFTGAANDWWEYATATAWPAEVLDDSIWSDLREYVSPSDVACDGVVGDCAAVAGCTDNPSGGCMEDPRLRITTVPASEHRHRVNWFEPGDTSELGVDPESPVTYQVDGFSDIASALGSPPGGESNLLLVEYGGLSGDGELRIPVPDEVDVAAVTHLSMRAGNVLELVDGCNSSSDEAVRFDVSLSRGGLEASVPLPTGRLPQQLRDGLFMTQCPSVQALQTVRFNLGEWCEFGTDEVDEVVLTFAEPVEPGRVFVDTIEFTDVPEDSVDDLPVCGESGVAGMWACEIDDLTITEASCAAQPTGAPATCATVDIRTNPVDPPEVELPGDTFDGWLVHTRPGMVYDIFDPTSDEVELVRSRCIDACELEYAGRPEIAVECSAANGFFTPTLVSDDSHASVFQIPRALVHGEFEPTDEMLDCDLRVDCCEAFDEGLCPARPWRTTEARAPLGRGEEWHYTTTGVIVIDSEAMDEPVMGDLQGTLGGSLCEGGNATEACPIYLGSATVELLEPIDVELDCGGTPVLHTLDELTLSLAQPAFGMQLHEAPDWSFFTPGSLVFDAHTVVDDLPIDTFLPNENGVTMKFNAGWAEVPLFSHFEVVIDVPCGEQTVPVSAWFGLVDDEVVGSPPYGVSITVPSTLTCPQTRGLTGTASDGQSDIAGVRWKVDDVLLAPGTTSMAFTQDHDLTAIVRDSRGATTTVHKHVDCI